MRSKSLVILSIILMALVLTSGCIRQNENVISDEKVNFQLIVEANGERITKEIDVNKGTNALEAMKSLADVNYTISALGAFVTAINGTPNTAEKYWLFWIDGNFADRAIDAYTINKDTEITWKFLSAEESRNYWS